MRLLEPHETQIPEKRDSVIPPTNSLADTQARKTMFF